MTSRKKPGVAFWATVGLVAVLLYVASFGPACGILHHLGDPDYALPAYWFIYAPIIWTYENGPERIRDTIEWYCRLWF